MRKKAEKCPTVSSRVGTWRGSDPVRGTDVALDTTSSEDIDGTYTNGPDLYLTSNGSFTVAGLSGKDEDVFTCEALTSGAATSCTGFSLFFDGSPLLPTGTDLDGIDFI